MVICLGNPEIRGHLYMQLVVLVTDLQENRVSKAFGWGQRSQYQGGSRGLSKIACEMSKLDPPGPRDDHYS